jgi:hypothetical protein
MSAGSATAAAAKATTLGIGSAVPSAMSVLTGLVSLQQQHPAMTAVALLCLLVDLVPRGYGRFEADKSARARERLEQQRYEKETQLREELGRLELGRYAAGHEDAGHLLRDLLGLSPRDPQ